MPKRKRTLIVSDIHGCLNPFQALLRSMEYDARTDQLIVLGDYVDRGPNSKEVIELLMAMVKDEGTIALRGNHDQRLVDLIRTRDRSIKKRFLEHGGGPTARSYLGLDESAAVDQQLTDEAIDRIARQYESHISFLEGLPYYYEDERHIYVHAGLNPAYKIWTSQPQHEFMTIKRPFLEQPTVVEKTVVFGHTKTVDMQGTADIWFGDGKIGVDGGCSFGYQLNGLIFDADLQTYQTCSVPAG
ncbi:metallophosphoesterase family protein [Paenibacillus spongiae]|uniref:Serine/threonine protein phosphatase n=1 Tax=Paenibacillus spongiae TaxID=2909671 RepID=A0ABY5S529_9BACL|nr:metallophosphoesterase family protein [Paenibacillus spongiae]UVI27972.1 serine/threonine protein phosphatase [Paenibacillus spongiae]